jgi:hypothetical protein
VRLLIIGDTHANTNWVRHYVYPIALTVGADAIVQLGDFGAWEHTGDGVEFMDQVGNAGQATGIPLYWLHGNHDKHSHTIKRYKRNPQGFRPCREYVLYVPQGHAWQWAGVSMRAFGGAYSVDKDWRIVRDARLGRKEYLWFPEEEMTDTQMTGMLSTDSSPKDIIFSHDKPFSSKPGWNRKDIAGCLPNQLRMERALRAHKPAWWFHGHLHYFYRDIVRGRDFQTTVFGLDPDGTAAEMFWKAQQTWAIADLDDGVVTVKPGMDTFIDPEALAENRTMMLLL